MLKSKQNFLERTIGFLSPGLAVRRLRARMAISFLNTYDGADKKRRALSQWLTTGADADGDILADLPTLRERSRDLVRNNPLAGGALKTKLTHVVGQGLRLQCRIDRDVLNMTEDQADAWEARTQREWRLFFDSKDVDIARTLTGSALTRMVYNQAKENGDIFILLPRKKRNGRAYDLCLQTVEADRVCNKDNVVDTDLLAGGIKKDPDGAPVEVHILKTHPGSMVAVSGLESSDWHVRKVFGEKTGLRNVIHLFNPTRPGQSRGVPDLAPVIEIFKQLGRYTEAEVTAAVVSGLFTIFIENEGGPGGKGFNYSKMGQETGQQASDKDVKLGPGLIVDLKKGEKVHDSNPGRPNQNFDGFVQAVLRQAGAGLEIPYEILVKHFTKSYSAARASLLQFWKYVMTERQWLADNFLKIIYEVWMYEAVAAGRISAPGFFADPGIRAAYLSSAWVGPAMGQIDGLKEVKAARERMAAKLTTLEQETMELTGGDWERNHPQQVKEYKKQVADGLIVIQEEADGEKE